MKVYKKAGCLLMVVAMMFSLVACSGGGGAKSGDANKAADAAAQTVVNNQPGSVANVQKELKVGGVSLPEGWPIELVPIMEDAVSGWGLNTAGNFNLSYTTPSSGEEVAKFYTDHFKKYGDALSVVNDNREINLTAEGKRVQIFIDRGAESTSLQMSINEEANNASSPIVDSSLQPEGTFPTTVVPIIDGASIIDQSSDSVTFSVNKPLKDVAAFYKQALQDMSNTNIQDGDDEFFATADNANNSIEIQITDNGDTSSMGVINVYPK